MTQAQKNTYISLMVRISVWYSPNMWRWHQKMLETALILKSCYFQSTQIIWNCWRKKHEKQRFCLPYKNKSAKGCVCIIRVFQHVQRLFPYCDASGKAEEVKARVRSLLRSVTQCLFHCSCVTQKQHTPLPQTCKLPYNIRSTDSELCTGRGLLLFTVDMWRHLFDVHHHIISVNLFISQHQWKRN